MVDNARIVLTHVRIIHIAPSLPFLSLTSRVCCTDSLFFLSALPLLLAHRLAACGPQVQMARECLLLSTGLPFICVASALRCRAYYIRSELSLERAAESSQQQHHQRGDTTASGKSAQELQMKFVFIIYLTGKGGALRSAALSYSWMRECVCMYVYVRSPFCQAISSASAREERKSAEAGELN